MLKILARRHRTGAVDARFITTHNIASDGETLTLPVSNDYIIDWGDGTVTTTGNSHVYATSGIKTVKMAGVVDDWAYNGTGDKDKILTVENWGGAIGIEGMFRLCSNLEYVNATDLLQLSNINRLFNQCGNLISVNNIGQWDVSNLSQCIGTFFACSKFNSNINDWDVSNINNMQGFSRCTDFNQPLDKWNTSKFTGLSEFFEDATSFNQEINNWDTSNVTSLFGTFYDASSFNKPLNQWNTSKVNLMSVTFRNATAFNQDISSWDYSKTKSILGFMQGKSSTNYDYQYYDNLLIKWDSDPSVGGLDFNVLTNLTTNMGTIQYSSVGASAHASLIAKGLIITDGGQNGF